MALLYLSRCQRALLIGIKYKLEAEIKPNPVYNAAVVVVCIFVSPPQGSFTTPLHWITILLGRVVTKVLAFDFFFIVQQSRLMTA